MDERLAVIIGSDQRDRCHLLGSSTWQEGMSQVIRPGELDEDRWERSRRVGWIDLDRVSESHAMVVGAGALGNEVVKNLVLSGFRNITLVDMDRVVRSNLNRCLFFNEADAERRSFKAEVLAQKAAVLDPQVRIEAITTRVQEVDKYLFEKSDLIFGCLDNIAARLHVNAHCFFHERPLVDGGTLGTLGKVQVVLPPDTPCLQCATNRTHSRVLEKRYSCSGSEVSYFEPKLAAEITTTSVIAAIQVREGLKIVSGLRNECLKHIMFYNGLKNTNEVLEVPLDEDCPVHPR